MESFVRPKLRVRRRDWNHHHRDGWGYVVREMLEKHFHSDDGLTECIASVEDEIVRISTSGSTLESSPFCRPWVGFVHQAVNTSYEDFPDLRRLVASPLFQRALIQCQGLFVLSSVNKAYLTIPREDFLAVNVCFCPYPAVPVPSRYRFSFEKFCENEPRRVVMIGRYLRKFQDIYDLPVPMGFQKYLLKPFDDERWDRLQLHIAVNETVKCVERQPSDNYDDLLSQSLVFLSLSDAAACTTVVECIARCTPLLVNRLPALEEYLGVEYPLFYESLNEAARLLTLDKIERTHRYLATMPKRRFVEPDSFLRAISNSAIYRSLPSSETSSRCDITVILCSYKRVDSMDEILRRLWCQDFAGSFEIIVWNNNSSTQSRLSALCQSYRSEKRRSVKLIHSSENYYCIVRQAIAHLMNGTTLVTCDDDVLPEPTYLSKFYAKYERYGESAALCCRGHIFRNHALDDVDPARFWTRQCESKIFCDETRDDVQVHFLHGCACLIPRRVLLRVLEYPMPDAEFALIDDYWLSFVVSHHLGYPIWKIQGSTMFTMTASAVAPDCAMALNPDVVEQRIKFYVYHMKEGWPGEKKKHADKRNREGRQVDVFEYEPTPKNRAIEAEVHQYQPLPDQYSF
ncbi:uncharacterized protein [Oscarella lobularis]|uniref:uncharacterized protein n=1 Tax=Oscarella lobularis TaxID=121494 RepID=UPI003313FC78